MLHVPIRTCVICRQRFPKQDLTRYVLGERVQGCDGDLHEQNLYTKVLHYDERGVLPGRGHYVCARGTCREKFATYTGFLKKRRSKRGK